jgi:hypothetical protein
MKTVKCTHEGLVGHTTACGYVIQPQSWFVALPHHAALRRVVRLWGDTTPGSFTAPVLDVGPWNTNDGAYVFGGARPAAESGLSVSGHGTNGSGIDLSDALWITLGKPDHVSWEFVG